MSVIALVTVLIGALAAPPTSAAQPDFAGTWVLDANRTEGVPPGLEQTMTVKRSGDRIEVETVTKSSMGEQRMQDEFVLDGSEVDFRPPVPAEVSATGKRTSRWSEGRTSFESSERATIQGPQGEITVTATRKWTLAPDGNTLTMDVAISSPQGEQKSTRVFARQPAGE